MNAFALLSVDERFPSVSDSAITVAVLTREWKTVCQIKRNNAGRRIEALLARKPPIGPRCRKCRVMKAMRLQS
jgi:hypothetical protein